MQSRDKEESTEERERGECFYGGRKLTETEVGRNRRDHDASEFPPRKKKGSRVMHHSVKLCSSAEDYSLSPWVATDMRRGARVKAWADHNGLSLHKSNALILIQVNN